MHKKTDFCGKNSITIDNSARKCYNYYISYFSEGDVKDYGIDKQR
jgi:hypothetical protein